MGPGEPECRTLPWSIPSPPEAPGHDLPGPTWGPVGLPPQQAAPPETVSSVYGGRSHYRTNYSSSRVCLVYLFLGLTHKRNPEEEKMNSGYPVTSPDVGRSLYRRYPHSYLRDPSG